MQRGRLQREREFHNARFLGGDNRETQDRFYWAIERGAEAYGKAVRRLAIGGAVLEYGCANGTMSEQIVSFARSVDAVDISDVAIRNAIARQPAPNIRFHVMDAMRLAFAECSFDLVFGSGIIHHLDTRRASQEVLRVLRPGGSAVFWEPMGTNPLINIYRKVTPHARTVDEHPLLSADIRIMRAIFASVDVAYYGLTTLLALPFRNVSMGHTIRGAFEKVDAALLACPGLHRLAWYAQIICKK